MPRSGPLSGRCPVAAAAIEYLRRRRVVEGSTSTASALIGSASPSHSALDVPRPVADDRIDDQGAALDAAGGRGIPVAASMRASAPVDPGLLERTMWCKGCFSRSVC